MIHPGERRLAWAWALAIVLGTLLTYHNTLTAEFVFDDQGAILDNPTIRQLWPLSTVLSPPIAGLPVTGRPVTNLSFALNHAVHGTDVRGYRAVNITIHILCALALFGVVRRTLARGERNLVPLERFSSKASPGMHVAGAVALLWVLHPLGTAAVTYVSQRAEALGSLFLLIALYAFIRGTETPRPRPWLIASGVACWLGIATKEFNAVIPVLIALYDRIFVSSSWREVIRARGVLHATLIASWLPLAWLILGTQNRGGTWAGDSGFTPWEYARVQCQALVHYLRLVFWPHPLVFDYGRNLPIPQWREVLPQASLILALIVATLVGLRRKPAAAFAGVVFFGILAPTTSVVPIADAMFEHRMYLPSAALLAVVVVVAFRRTGPWLLWAILPLAVLLGSLTHARNADYRTALGLWQDTVAKRPANARALGNLGTELIAEKRHDEAVRYLAEAYRMTPHVPLVPHNLAIALDFAGRRDEAISHYREAIALEPKNFLARCNLANALAEQGALAEAMAEYETALGDAPDFVDAHRGYARVLMRADRLDEAIDHFRRAASLRPGDPEAHFNLGDALARAGRFPKAIVAFRETVRLRPHHAMALNNLGNALLLTHQVSAAIDVFQNALRLAPDPMTHTNLGYALLLGERRSEAVAQLEAALRLDPAYAPARDALQKLRGTTRAP